MTTSRDPVLDVFLRSASDALSTMAGTELAVQSTRAAERFQCVGDYSATVGLVDGERGSMVVSLSAPAARAVVAGMLGMGPEEAEAADLEDGVGELANMIAGGAKTALEGTPNAFDFSLPTVVTTPKPEIAPPRNVPGFVVEATVAGEPFSLAVWKRDLSAKT